MGPPTGEPAIRACSILFRRSYDTVTSTWGAWSQTGAIDTTNTSIRAIGIDPSGPATLFAATDAGLFRSTNAGTNWSAINTGLLQGRAMVVKPGDPTRLVTAFSGGGLFRSTDRGTSWAEPAAIPANSFTTSLLHDPYTAGVVYAGSGAGIFRSADDGDTWSDITTDLGVTDVHALAIDPTAPHDIFAGTGNGVFSWNGTAWTAYNSASLVNKDVLALAFNGTSLFAGTNGGGVYRSDSGGSWSQQINGLSGTIVNALAVGAGTVYAGTNAGVHKTTSNGATWDAINSGITTLNILSLTVNATTSDAPSAATLTTLAAGTSGGGVFISNNDGVSWSAVNTRLTDLKVNGIAADSGWPQYLHAATFSKAFSLKMSPVIRVLPASGTNYGNANIISAPSSQTYTLTNNGPLALVISDVSAGSLAPTGTTATITAGTCPAVPLAADSASMVTLAPGASCTLAFNFTPAAVGAGSAVITFTSSDVSSPVTAVTLAWTGVDPPPTSSITSPLAATTIRTPPGYAIGGSASDVGSGLLRVEVSTDGVNWSSAVGTTSWTFSWQPVLDAAYTVRSRAIDVNGNVQTTPASVSVNVDNTAPAAVISSPLNNASVRGTTVTVTGTAADPTSAGSGIRQVDVSTDGGTTWLPASGTASWTFTWTLPADGTYTLQARATDHAGNQGSSTTVSVRVDKTAPAVAITAPTSGTTLPVGTSYTIAGTATDTGGSGVNLVEISLDSGTTWLTTTYDAVGGTWSYPWTLPVNSTYQILARASDVAGNTATTSAITATINNPLPSATIVAPASGAFVNGLSLAISGTALAGNPVLGLSRV
ncbi:MAG: Ig-like domain repeat protein [Geobacter sp.]|nr:Ig-like domain repeat protein [Geobacter sp.]